MSKLRSRNERPRNSQVHVVDLKAGDPEQEQCKGSTEAMVYPIIVGIRFVVVGDQDRSPDPPDTLKSEDGEKGRSSSELQRKLLSVEKEAQRIPGSNRNDARQERAKRSGSDA